MLTVPMDIMLKDVSASLYKQLSAHAKLAGSTLDVLILRTLNRAFGKSSSDRAAVVERIRQQRNRLEVWLTDDDIQSAIKEGRE